MKNKKFQCIKNRTGSPTYLRFKFKRLHLRDYEFEWECVICANSYKHSNTEQNKQTNVMNLVIMFRSVQMERIILVSFIHQQQQQQLHPPHPYPTPSELNSMSCLATTPKHTYIHLHLHLLCKSRHELYFCLKPANVVTLPRNGE